MRIHYDAMSEINGWADLVAHLGRTQRDVQTFDGGLARFTTGPAEAPLPVGVHALGTSTKGMTFDSGQAADAEGAKTWFGLAVKICPFERVRPRPALVANLDLPVGALGAAKDALMLQQTLPLAGLETAALDATIRALAELARELRAAAGGADGAYAYIFR